jgi:hypothetical protein
MTTQKRAPKPPASEQLLPTADAARGLAKALSAETDDLNTKIARVEKRLIGLGLGVTAWVDMTTAAEAKADRTVSLGFRKFGPVWQLVVASGSKKTDPLPETPLLQAPKQLRIRGAEMVPTLLKLMLSEARKQLEEVKRASKGLDDLLAGTEELHSPVPTLEDADLPRVDTDLI